MTRRDARTVIGNRLFGEIVIARIPGDITRRPHCEIIAAWTIPRVTARRPRQVGRERVVQEADRPRDDNCKLFVKVFVELSTKCLVAVLHSLQKPAFFTQV